ncbi:MAG: excinuclease ABC subunit UvrC [Bacteroidales bacterium]|jgi:excinuclease ABC subunit C|nr:excinuclease ABC subunit UvrC [Bacteroidales bacterium]MCI2121171.1 excinuclease ABC subunit UvrC [Bacteroidales bacterium]MCI2145041.1 excinuclease ABC subunit UvrC [Bacteroidales bacterium]
MVKGFESMTPKEKVAFLPNQPGVYRFLDAGGKVIYVGKAKNLKKRVSSYFRPPDQLNVKTRVMVAKIADLMHTVVDSEQDALLLENNLIKKYQPRYNILLKDGKTYPWICVSAERYPRIFVTRRVVHNGSKYFGPYGSVLHARGLTELIHNLFSLRDCKHTFTDETISSGRIRPCLDYHIGRCAGVCNGSISENEYDSRIEKAISILKGEVAPLIREFDGKMKEAAANLDFETAQSYKDKKRLLEEHYAKSLVVNPSITKVDVFSLTGGEDDRFGNFMRIQDGAIIQSLSLELKAKIEEEPSDMLSAFIGEIFSKYGELSREILVPFMPGDDLEGHEVHVPERGDKLKLLELSLKNAEAMKTDAIKQEAYLRPDEHRRKIVERLKDDLGMKEDPVHIECFDNSNIQGTNPVASCVVFKDCRPDKKEYRHFNIRTVTGANDYASMTEVVYRRYSRLLEEKKPLPQLVVIDGGQGQLHSALIALEKLGLQDRIFTIGLAKRLEEVVIPGDPHPLFLDKNSSSLRILMQIRDEAHRFGITHHRNRRSRAQIHSALTDIKGIGDKTEIALLRKFKSVSGVKSATEEQLVATVGRRAANCILTWRNNAV